MLEVRGLAVSYGRHQALAGVDLHVAPGEIVVILGANGAGKTTLLKAVAGLVPAAASSQVRLDGQSISALPPHRIVEAGLALVPEGRGVFADLSVRENLLLGAYAQRARAGEAAQLERVLGLFPKLAERSAQQVRTMSGGEQQMVAIGRALMSAPAILMLDEPSLGLSPLLCTELFKALKAVRGTGVGILLVEQNARQSLAIADRAYLLENGHVVGEGPADELARDPAVQAAYLGGAAASASGPVKAVAAVPASPRATALPAPSRSASVSAQSATAAPRSTPAATLIPMALADLVRTATRVQAEHVDAMRDAGPVGRPSTAARTPAAAGRTTAAPIGEHSLAEAIARIEAAAAAARRPASTAPPRPAVAPPRASELPTIEVWRRPPVEVWRRAPDGTMKKEN